MPLLLRILWDNSSSLKHRQTWRDVNPTPYWSEYTLTIELEAAFRCMRDKKSLKRRIADLARGVDLGKLKIPGKEEAHQPAVHIACRIGNEAAVSVLLKHHSAKDHVQLSDPTLKNTALHCAAVSGSLKVMHQLIVVLIEMKRKPELDARNKKQQTALHIALENGNVEAAEFLISLGADIHATAQGSTLLHFAAKSGELAAVELVQKVTNDLHVNKTNDFGVTALHFAVACGQRATVDWLLQKGADLTIIDNMEGFKGLPLHWAASLGHIDIVVQLMSKGATTPLVHNTKEETVLDLLGTAKGETVIELLGNRFIWSKGESRDSLLKGLMERMEDLHLDSISLSLRMARYVAQYGSEKTNQWLVSRLKSYKQETGDVQRVLQILTSHVDKKRECTLLELAAETSNLPSIEPLVGLFNELVEDHGKRDKYLKDAFHEALLHGRTEFQEALVGAFEKRQKLKLATWIKEIQRNFCPPDIAKGLDAAIEVHKELTRENELDKEKVPFALLLFWRRCKRSSAIAQGVIDLINRHDAWSGIINETDEQYKRTALHWAVLFKQADVVTKLCDIKECDALATDKNDKTPFEYTFEKKYFKKTEKRKEDSETEKIKEDSETVNRQIRTVLSVREDMKEFLAIRYENLGLFVVAFGALMLGGLMISTVTCLAWKTRASQKNKIFKMCSILSCMFGMATSIISTTSLFPRRGVYVIKVARTQQKNLRCAIPGFIASLVFCIAACYAANA